MFRAATPNRIAASSRIQDPVLLYNDVSMGWLGATSFLMDLNSYPTTENPLLLLASASHRAAGAPSSPTLIQFDDLSTPTLIAENASSVIKTGLWYAWAPDTFSVLVEYGAALSGERHSLDIFWVENALSIGDTDTQGYNTQSITTNVSTSTGLALAFHYIVLGGGFPTITPPAGYAEVMNDSSTSGRDYAATRTVPAPSSVLDTFFWGTTLSMVLHSVVFNPHPLDHIAAPSRT